MELGEFRAELLDTLEARLPKNPSDDDRTFAFLCEVGERLTQAEEFTDFIPSHFKGAGTRKRVLCVDGYQMDESDNSLRLIVCDFRGENQLETITRTQADKVFGQLQAFVEEAISGSIWSNTTGNTEDSRELAGLIERSHGDLFRYRFFLLTDAVLSNRVKDFPGNEIQGKTVEFHIWDISRLQAVAQSKLGVEDLFVDFTEFVSDGLPCLRASHTDEYEGYLAVISGEVLADIYERYGSRLMEGNVRSFLTARGKVNRGIQGTIRKEPAKFFVYNNGISGTATSAELIETVNGPRLISVKNLQIVNGGQTTASLHTARIKDRIDLSDTHVQMKLSVVTEDDSDKLEEIIHSIARYSNSQNVVSDADFFSNHPYHRAMEQLSRRVTAPAVAEAQYQTYWFYERARGQYQNQQINMSQAERRRFSRNHPRAQLIVKTDIAKYENSWRQLPHVVSLGAQKNFKIFAEHAENKWGDNGHAINNEGYFKQLIAHAILFRSVEKLVSSASWYQGGYRANIVTYTVAKLANMIGSQKSGYSLDFKIIWQRQSLPSCLESMLERIAERVADAITSPPIPQMNITEWCKKKECWDKVRELKISLDNCMVSMLQDTHEARQDDRENRQQGALDAGIDAVTKVIELTPSYWSSLRAWAEQYSKIYGRDADLVRNAATKPTWIPSDKQAKCLLEVSRRLEEEGFSKGV